MAVLVDLNATKVRPKSGPLEIELCDARSTAGGHDELITIENGAFAEGEREAGVIVSDFL